MAEGEKCRHFWRIRMGRGKAKTKGKCSKCGLERKFNNSFSSLPSKSEFRQIKQIENTNGKLLIASNGDQPKDYLSY